MKFKYFLIIPFLISFNNFSFSEEIDCKQFKKFSTKYIECNAKKLKKTTSEKIAKSKKKIEKTDTKKKLNKFKNSKTLSDLINKQP